MRQGANKVGISSSEKASAEAFVLSADAFSAILGG
jgi:hypothetical protein